MKAKILNGMCAAMLCLGLVWAGVGCDQPGVGSGTGTLVMNLTDAPDEDARAALKQDGAEEVYEQVYITFTEISVHRAETDKATDDDDDLDDDNATNDDDNGTEVASGWIVISGEEQGFDLMQLQDGAFELLAESELDAGKYSQVRLKITDAEDVDGMPKTYVQVAGEKFELTVPSGTKSGLKLTKGFTISDNQTTVLFLDFDAQRSVHKTGSGKYQMKPTIKILDTAPEGPGGDDNETEVPDEDNETEG